MGDTDAAVGAAVVARQSGRLHLPRDHLCLRLLIGDLHSYFSKFLFSAKILFNQINEINSHFDECNCILKITLCNKINFILKNQGS